MSTSLDGATCEVFKSDDRNALQWLLHSPNATSTSGEIPASWKHTEVVPILRPGKTVDQLTNLQPLVLTSTLCKLLECMLATRLSWWFESYRWYHSAQFGFHLYVGTEDSLEHLSNMVLLGIHRP